MHKDDNNGSAALGHLGKILLECRDCLMQTASRLIGDREGMRPDEGADEYALRSKASRNRHSWCVKRLRRMTSAPSTC